MSQPAASPMPLVRVTLVSEDRRLDVGVPGSIPLVEVIPGFARTLGVLDASVVHAGYALGRADGGQLDSSLSLTAQGVQEGDVLTLHRGGLVAEPRVYDDVTEAVIDATVDQHRPWSPLDSSRTALAISLAFLTVCAVLLLLLGPSVTLAPVLAGGGAAVLLLVSAVLARAGQPEAGHAFGFAATVYAGLGGYLIVDSLPRAGWPLAVAGLAAAATSALALALNPHHRAYHWIGISAGVVIAVPGIIVGAVPEAAVAAYALTVALASAASNLLPWLAWSSTRIQVVSPRSDQEIFADPTPIDAATVAERAATGARVLGALRLGIGIAVLIATPVVAASGVAGALLSAAAFVGMMFPSRQAYARAAVAAVMVVGSAGIVATALTVAATQAQRLSGFLVILVAATTVLVAVTVLQPRARVWLARAADAAEIVVLTMVLPLGVIAAGLAH